MHYSRYARLIQPLTLVIGSDDLYVPYEHHEGVFAFDHCTNSIGQQLTVRGTPGRRAGIAVFAVRQLVRRSGIGGAEE
ncbi:MAG: hypothetical protein JSV80_05945 [Acidobacteriota bacterium]|nr:MAG: hypothetical protein JSV80_05945 [Acidobacteriota bacterium]